MKVLTGPDFEQTPLLWDLVSQAAILGEGSPAVQLPMKLPGLVCLRIQRLCAWHADP